MFKFMCIPALILCALLQAPSTEADFLSGYEEVQALMNQGEWSAARDRLKGLIEEHREKSYVKIKRIEIEECLKNCAFWERFDDKGYDELISGRLHYYRPRSGEIKLEYGAETAKDFKPPRELNLLAPPDLLMHPALFSGPYTLEFSGRAYPSLAFTAQEKMPTVHVCCQDNKGYAICFGHDKEKSGRTVKQISASIRCWTEDEMSTRLCKKPSPARSGKRFQLKVKVGKKEIAAYCHNRMLFKVDKPDGLYGGFGYSHLPFEKIVVQGRIQSSWLEGMRDKAVHEERKRFEKSYDLDADLPEWLRGGKGKGFFERLFSALGDRNDDAYPGKLLPGQSRYVEKAIRFLHKEALDEGIEYIAQIPADKISVAGRAWLFGLAYLRKEDYVQAFAELDKVCRLEPDFIPSGTMRARCRFHMKRIEEALQESRDLVKAHPEDVQLHRELAEMLLYSGKPREAKELIDRTLKAGLDPEELQSINAILVKALQGPRWAEVQEQESKHYHLFSDMDARTCREARNVLEEAYTMYTRSLERVEDQGVEKFRVYLFSGESGYKAYCKGIGSELPMKTGGLYSPALKQLMIWNLPDREDMLRTVRHEGFHQYLDRVMVHPPRWFNEGLAQYYEIARRERGVWKLGGIYPEYEPHLSDLKYVLIPLKEFIYQGDRAFLEKADLNYAQSWLFIHFLLHGTEENRALFDRLFEALQGEAPTKAVLDEVFGEMDLKEFHYRFKDYVRKLAFR